MTTGPMQRYKVSFNRQASGTEKWLNAWARKGYVLHSAHVQPIGQNSTEDAYNGMWVIMELERKGDDNAEI